MRRRRYPPSIKTTRSSRSTGTITFPRNERILLDFWIFRKRLAESAFRLRLHVADRVGLGVRLRFEDVRTRLVVAGQVVDGHLSDQHLPVGVVHLMEQGLLFLIV